MKKELGLERIKFLPSEDTIVEIDGAMYRCCERYDNDTDVIEILFADVYDEYSLKKTEAHFKASGRTAHYAVVSDESLLIPFIKFLTRKAQDIKMGMVDVFILGLDKSDDFHYFIMEQLNKIAYKVVEGDGDTVELEIYFEPSAINSTGEIKAFKDAYRLDAEPYPFDARSQWQKSAKSIMSNSHYGVIDDIDMVLNKKNTKVFTKAALTTILCRSGYRCNMIINNSTVNSINWRIKYVDGILTAYIVSVERNKKYFKKVYDYFVEQARMMGCEQIEVDPIFARYFSCKDELGSVRTIVDKMGFPEKYYVDLTQ